MKKDKRNSTKQLTAFIKFLCIGTILLQSVSSFITRLPCNLYTSFTLIRSKYYLGDIVKTYSATSVNHCSIRCLNNSVCTFANFNKNDGICRLMSSKANSSDSLVDHKWQVILSKTDNNTNVGLICENTTPCESLYCRDICLAGNPLVHSFICLETSDASRTATPYMSTIWPGSNPKSAIDGNFNTEASTQNSVLKWFKLDLKYIFQIYQIVIYTKSFPLRSNGNRLFVSITGLVTDYHQVATLNSDVNQIFSGPYVARYIIVIKDSNELLTIQEINVYV